MSILPQSVAEMASESLEERSALDLLAAHADAKDRLLTAEYHLVCKSFNAGLGEERIAEQLRCSRGPVRTHLAKGRALGDITRTTKAKAASTVTQD